MTTPPITAIEFQQGVNAAVQAVLNVYREVRGLFDELADALDRGEPRLVHLGPKLVPEGGKESWENRILRSWQARLYIPADTADAIEDEGGGGGDDEGETEETGGKTEELAWGQSLLFAKAIIYKPGEAELVPSLIYGLLSDCHIGAQNTIQDAPLTIPRTNLKHVLSEMNHATPAGRYKTSATVTVQKGRRVRAADRCLIFTVAQPPTIVPLYDIGSHEAVLKIADGMARLWKSGNAG